MRNEETAPAEEASDAPGIVVAKESFSTEINGTPRVVTKGETFREGHPVVEGREELFKPFEVDNEIETATAAPGEPRQGAPATTEPTAADGQPDPVAGGDSEGAAGEQLPAEETPTDSADNDGEPAADPETGSSAGGGDGEQVPEPIDYSGWKRQQLVEELQRRELEFPAGVGVKNTALAEILAEDDARRRAEAAGGAEEHAQQ